MQRKNAMKDRVPAPRAMLHIGQPHVGSMVITDSPQKSLYSRVQWFDVRRMTYREASNLANGLALLGDTVMFDCFGQIVMGGRIKDSGGL